MRFYFHKKTKQKIEYNIRLIEKILGSYMTDDVNLADYVLLSLCDISEIGEVFKAKKYGKPVIIGGMVSEYPIANELADYVWHGEIYGFRKDLDSGKRLIDMDSITTKEKKSLVINQWIDWKANPIIRVGNRAHYYYVSKSCPMRCKFCLISYARKYQVVPESLYRKAEKAAGKGLMPIAAFNPYGTGCKTNIGETFLKNYIKGNAGKGASTLRAGVEFCTEELSKNLAKGVTADDFYAAIEKSEHDKSKLILYFIAGLEPQEVIEDYFSKIPISYGNKNPITIVFTYIDPQPFTPFYYFDLRQKVDNIDAKKIYQIATQRNKRIRIMPLAPPSKSTLRTLYGRATSIEEYKYINSIKKHSHAEIVRDCAKRHEHLLGYETIEEIKSRPRKRTAIPYWGEATYVA